MKLINGLKKGLVVLTLILGGTVANARVFWNKVEATVNSEGLVTLTWNVTEYNNKNFQVLHSIDGIKWETLVTIESQNSTQSMTDYSFSHRSSLSGKHYYRVMDTDIDIAYSSYSPIKTLVIKNDKSGVSVWPNPATDRIRIESNDNTVYVKATIFNLTGKVMVERELNAHVNELSINELSAGAYILKMETSTGTSRSQKFIKQ